MQLILVRHGEAELPQSNDAERNLTLKGIAQADSTAQQVLERYHPDLLVVSPYLRAQQTMSVFQKNGSNVPLHVLEGITPDADPRAALDELSLLISRYSAQCIVVVCHMNIIVDMASLVTDQEAESFGLAEARVYEYSDNLLGFSVEKERFLPLQDLN
jgi:phosphohistidine phosphatase